MHVQLEALVLAAAVLAASAPVQALPCCTYIPMTVQRKGNLQATEGHRQFASMGEGRCRSLQLRGGGPRLNPFDQLNGLSVAKQNFLGVGVIVAFVFGAVRCHSSKNPSLIFLDRMS